MIPSHRCEKIFFLLVRFDVYIIRQTYACMNVGFRVVEMSSILLQRSACYCRTRHVYTIWKRNYHVKKLNLQAIKNPYLQSIVQEQQSKREPRGTLERLIEKR
jgi:hypothetical protein